MAVILTVKPCRSQNYGFEILSLVVVKKICFCRAISTLITVINYIGQMGRQTLFTFKYFMTQFTAYSLWLLLLAEVLCQVGSPPLHGQCSTAGCLENSIWYIVPISKSLLFYCCFLPNMIIFIDFLQFPSCDINLFDFSIILKSIF